MAPCLADPRWDSSRASRLETAHNRKRAEAAAILIGRCYPWAGLGAGFPAGTSNWANVSSSLALTLETAQYDMPDFVQWAILYSSSTLEVG